MRYAVLDAQQVALQGCSTHGYENFHVERDTDERETHLDEFVGPQLEPQLSTLTRASSGKLLKCSTGVMTTSTPHQLCKQSR